MYRVIKQVKLDTVKWSQEVLWQGEDPREYKGQMVSHAREVVKFEVKDKTWKSIVDPRRLLIISRHPAAIEFIRSHKVWKYAYCISEATAADVRGCAVAGNLPMHLACLCDNVNVVEFTGEAPRGREYTLDEMVEAGAVLRRYEVRRG